MRNIEYKDGFLLVSNLGWIYRLEDWGSVNAKLVNAVGGNKYFINKEVNMISLKEYTEFLQTKYIPFFLQMNDLITYEGEILRFIWLERDSDTRKYIVTFESLDSKGKYKYTMKYVCDEKFIKGFEYADKI